jgi:hypothetical protein
MKIRPAAVASMMQATIVRAVLILAAIVKDRFGSWSCENAVADASELAVFSVTA